jgi:hypothetical protein
MLPAKHGCAYAEHGEAQAGDEDGATRGHGSSDPIGGSIPDFAPFVKCPNGCAKRIGKKFQV